MGEILWLFCSLKFGNYIYLFLLDVAMMNKWSVVIHNGEVGRILCLCTIDFSILYCYLYSEVVLVCLIIVGDLSHVLYYVLGFQQSCCLIFRYLLFMIMVIEGLIDCRKVMDLT